MHEVPTTSTHGTGPRWLGWLAGALMLALAGCTQDPPQPPSPPAASAVIGPAGGEVQASAQDGATYRLSIPAGALDREITVAIQPHAAAGGELAALTVSPADLQLHAPAMLEVTLPPGVTVPGDATFHLGGTDAPVYVATSRLASRLTAELRFFTLPLEAHVGGVEPASAPELAARHVLGPAQSEADGEVVASRADCASKLASAKHSYQLFFASESFESAVRAATNGRAVAQDCGDYEAFHEFQSLTKPAACARYDEVVLNADVIAATTYEVFAEIVQPVIAWAATLQRLGVECPATATWKSVVHGKFSQFVQFYRGSLDDLPSEHESLLDEAKKVIDLRGLASLLDMDDIATDLEKDVSDPILEMHRDEAYQECLQSTDHYYLYSLFEAVFGKRRVPVVPILPAGMLPSSVAGAYTDADLVDDVQLCASSFTVEVWSDPDVPVELTDQRVEFEPAQHAGEHEKEAENAGPVTGHLVLRGQVEQMRCGQGRNLVDHELVVLVGGEEEHRAATLDAFPEVDILAALEARSLSTTHVNTLDVVLRRESGACGGLYEKEYDLFTVSFEADPAPVAKSATSSPGAVPAETDVAVTYTIDWFDDGENLRRARIDYELGSSSASTEVDLVAGGNASGFGGKEGTGTITVTHYVFCSEEGNDVLSATITLFDEFGQASEPVSADVMVSYAGCGALRSPPPEGSVVLGGPR